jgi:hypothetical protein
MSGFQRSKAPRQAGAGLAIAAALLVAADSSAQMVIDDIAITSGPAYEGGVFSDYFIDPVVFGSGIASVTISSQFGGLSETLFEVTPGEFICDQGIPSEPCENFASLGAISALGALTFDFVGDMGEMDSETIPLADYDPGSGQTGFPAVTFPSYGEIGVSPTATLTWNPPPSWVLAASVGIENVVTGVTPDEDLFQGSPVTTTSWAPAGMTSGEAYDFEISFFDPIEFEDPRTTNGARAYLFTSAFESYNSVVFAVPEPGVVPAFAAGLLLMRGLARRRRKPEPA